jgi:hypothetical protein
MKNSELYKEYIAFLDWKLAESKINHGKYSLLKMSGQSFEAFKIRFKNDETFSDKIVEIMKVEVRDQKIDNIFDEFD